VDSANKQKDGRLEEFTLASLVKKNKKRKDEQAKTQTQILQEALVVLGTLTGSPRELELLPPGHFSLTVVDECGQAMEAAVWAVVRSVLPPSDSLPRFSCQLVLAGDHLQLPPTVLAKKPKVKAALSVSMMERLAEGLFKASPLVTLLDTQYRMNETIMVWPSDTFYGGKLRASPRAAGRTLAGLDGVWRHGPDGVRRNSTTKCKLVLLDTGGLMGQSGARGQTSIANRGEAGVIFREVRNLVENGVSQNDIGVISFYAMQVELIGQLLGQEYPDVEVNSVDGFQGREKEVVLLSTVRSNPERSLGFLTEHRRLNVAVTRARRQLVVVADRQTLASDAGLFAH
jgi:ATP-dependent RNA/DNA helicase IGHMBP2